MIARQTIEFRSSFSRQTAKLELLVEETRSVGSRGDLILDGPDVCAKHFNLAFSSEGWTVTPIANNLVAINGQQLTATGFIADGDWLSLGTTLYQVSLPQQSHYKSTTSTSKTDNTKIIELTGKAFTIGRLPTCDLTLSSPIISREHTRLQGKADQVTIEDLGSTNGTFVNGQRLTGEITLKAGDRIAIASYAYLFTGQALMPITQTGTVRVEVKGLSKQVVDHVSKTRKYLLEDVNLVIEPGEFVVIFGASGSGKSTLLDALNGRRPASSGKVLYNDVDLNTCFDTFRAAIGYVPQQDIVHRKIKTGRALGYTARLRLPKDTDAAEILKHIQRVLSKVKLADKAESPIDTPAPLSGGQLKRISLAVELIANPNILFLDEVTSGLDAGTDKHMMKLFAELAKDEKTVVCITHSLENIEVCDLVLLLHKGRVIYYGPPQQACAYFGIDRLSEVYELLEDGGGSAQSWAERYRASIFYTKYVTDRISRAEQLPELTLGHEPASSIRSFFDWRQVSTLTQRYFDLVLSDRKNLLILLLQAPLIAVLIGLVFNLEGDEVTKAHLESTTAFMLVLSAIWFGALNAAREVVKELPIYLRERSVNLGIIPYLTSKLLPLALLCLVQCVMLLGIVYAMLPLTLGFWGGLLAIFLAAFSASCMGLAVSAFVDTNDKAVAIAPILLVPQVVMSNAVVPLGTVSQWVAKSSMISFWALDAMKNTFPPKTLELHDLAGNLAVPLTSSLNQDLSMVAFLAFGFMVISVVGLKLKDRPQ